ncbi:MAG: alkaline phosphatase family protein, partial [Candidatus Latescibacteria bacterium]|nr:alkaline phosphatase family protein [Candidatus Latescibacterota bacterium]
MSCFSPFARMLVLIAAVLSIAAATPAPRPRLVVLIIIDQFRADYLTRFSDLFSPGGFRRLMDGGAWMTDATYNHLHVTTIPGHSVITSGTYGYRSGMIDNYWFDRAAGQPRPALADSQYHILGKQPQPDDHTSPRSIQGSTLSDELRMATNFKGKAVAIAMKDYSAIVCAGTLGTPYWFDTGAGLF